MHSFKFKEFTKKGDALVRYFFIVLILSTLIVPLSGHSRAFFSPDDKITAYLIDSIKNANIKIYAAVYLISDQKIVTALVEAKKNKNIDIQIVTDQTTLEQNGAKIQSLKQGGIDVFVFKSITKNKYPPLMHDKFAIIDYKIWTGSFNWTVSANRKHQENVVLISDKNLYQQYRDQFEKLKRRCVYQPTITPKIVRKKKRAWYKKAIKNVDRFLTMLKRKLGHSKKKT